MRQHVAVLLLVVSTFLFAYGHALHGVAPGVRSSITMTEAKEPELELVLHQMPLMPPKEYEAVLEEAMQGRGDILRWYIANVDREKKVVTAEIVMRRRDESTVWKKAERARRKLPGMDAPNRLN